MKPLYLSLENFICHEFSEIDLSSFNSVLIVGRVDGNDLRSNGVGKSTIFKAIEFVIFNECAKGLKLEKLVRDDTNKCKVVFDFEIDNKIYRISRARTKKGATDLSLFERTTHSDPSVNPHCGDLPEDTLKQFWQDISSRRVQDTEEMLEKIHKLNYKSFCSGYYFAQEDRDTGLATATKGERKEILKSSLQLTVYSALNKLASARASALTKDLDKKKAVLESIGNPIDDISKLEQSLVTINSSILIQSEFVKSCSEDVTSKLTIVTDLKNQSKSLADQVDLVLKKRKDINAKINNIQISVNDYFLKKKNLANTAKALVIEIQMLKESILNIINTDFSRIVVLKNDLETNKESVGQKNGLIRSLQDSLVELRIPLPDESFCKHCRQLLTDEHRREREKSTNEEIAQKEAKIIELKSDIAKLTVINKIIIDDINTLEATKKQLEAAKANLSSKEKEFLDKQALHKDYGSILDKHNLEFEATKVELEKVELEVEASSSKELNELQKLINEKALELSSTERALREEQSKYNKLTNDKAVIEHSIFVKKNDIKRKEDLKKEIDKLEEDFSVFPDVLEAYGPTGIPNLIIQNILDDLQIEANSILEQIRPGLQLAFSIEKTKGDGQLDDDLDIDYYLNGKNRDYQQLSGAQKLCVMFSLKLGVAYMQKKILGTKMQMLLLDEIDPALDKASVDALAEIIKFFQKDFTILVITHNDRLQGKFQNVIVVEQNQNMVSTAKILNV